MQRSQHDLEKSASNALGASDFSEVHLRGKGILITDFKMTSNFMMRSSNGNIFRVTGHLCEEFPAQRPVTQSFDVFCDLRLNKQLSKQSRGWWSEMPSRQLWRHCNVTPKPDRNRDKGHCEWVVSPVDEIRWNMGPSTWVSFLKIHQISIHAKLTKPKFSVIFAWNWTNVTQKANQFWTLTHQVYTPRLKWIEWLIL